MPSFHYTRGTMPSFHYTRASMPSFHYTLATIPSFALKNVLATIDESESINFNLWKIIVKIKFWIICIIFDTNAFNFVLCAINDLYLTLNPYMLIDYSTAIIKMKQRESVQNQLFLKWNVKVCRPSFLKIICNFKLEWYFKSFKTFNSC